MAPSFDDDALAVLTAKKNLRVLAAPPPGTASRSTCAPSTAACSCRSADPVVARPRALAGRHQGAARRGGVGRPRRSRGRCARRCRSNAIVLGQGRPGRRASAPASRTGSTRPASPPSRPPGGPPAGLCASDAFFPFRDGLDAVGGGRRARRDPARRHRPRRRGDRGRRRARHRHGLHRRAPLPAILILRALRPARSACRRVAALGVRWPDGRSTVASALGFMRSARGPCGAGPPERFWCGIVSGVRRTRASTPRGPAK